MNQKINTGSTRDLEKAMQKISNKSLTLKKKMSDFKFEYCFICKKQVLKHQMKDHMYMHLLNPEPVQGVKAKNYCVVDVTNDQVLINLWQRKVPSYSNIPCKSCGGKMKWTEYMKGKKIWCDGCGAKNIKNFHRCHNCDHDLCKNCVEKYPKK